VNAGVCRALTLTVSRFEAREREDMRATEFLVSLAMMFVVCMLLSQ
jgi:hypothetical protein